MAQLRPKLQQFIDLKDGNTVGIHLVTVISTSDYFYVPKLAQRAANSVSSGLLRRADGSTATVTDNAATADSTAYGGNTITITSGTAGQDLLIATVHSSNVINYGDEN